MILHVRIDEDKKKKRIDEGKEELVIKLILLTLIRKYIMQENTNMEKVKNR